MFGYIQPLKCELKMREYDYYRAAYCGLCNALYARCGMKARFIVNYDFAFLALAMSAATEDESQITVKKRRCIACPTGRSCMISDAYAIAADASVILTYLKLCDNVRDTVFLKRLFTARIPRMLLRGAYKRASKNFPDYNTRACELLSELFDLERESAPSIDEPADKFALMLSATVDDTMKNARPLREMLYHIGRFVYILDALDDFEEDFERGGYNPIAARFSVGSKTIPKDIIEEVLITLEHSRLSVLRAFELFGSDRRGEVIRNIIELGMPAAVKRVIDKKGEKTR